MLGPVFSGWGVAKWQGTWLWTTHSEVRILPPQLCLPGRTETVLAVTPARSVPLPADIGSKTVAHSPSSTLESPFQFTLGR